MSGLIEIREVPIGELVPDPENVRLHDDKNMEAIKSSLDRFGQAETLVVCDETMTVIGGNARLAAMRELGWKSAKCAMMNLSKSSRKALAIALNRTAELAEWDDEALAKQLSALQIEDEALVEAAGFSDEEITKILEGGGIFDIEAAEMPTLPDGDRAPYQQKTFTLHDEQCEDVDAAVSIAKDMGHNQSPINENSNGNALAFICQFFVRAHQ